MAENTIDSAICGICHRTFGTASPHDYNDDSVKWCWTRAFPHSLDNMIGCLRVGLAEARAERAEAVALHDDKLKALLREQDNATRVVLECAVIRRERDEARVLVKQATSEIARHKSEAQMSETKAVALRETAEKAARALNGLLSSGGDAVQSALEDLRVALATDVDERAHAVLIAAEDWYSTRFALMNSTHADNTVEAEARFDAASIVLENAVVAWSLR